MHEDEKELEFIKMEIKSEENDVEENEEYEADVKSLQLDASSSLVGKQEEDGSRFATPRDTVSSSPPGSGQRVQKGSTSSPSPYFLDGFYQGILLITRYRYTLYLLGVSTLYEIVLTVLGESK